LLGEGWATFSWQILKPALWVVGLEGNTALDAKLHNLGILKTTAQTLHCHPPRDTMGRWLWIIQAAL
jgi:hypothetical protein